MTLETSGWPAARLAPVQVAPHAYQTFNTLSGSFLDKAALP